ncbi:hypothetical protein [Mycoplasma parvum]|uniref:Uncharacterized protein n=1 Tax=Mycoplasma parvum str. Indiana TaxID=1403316 RepID=U5NC25_9MOLU|nr:hypothetical protein [Mycoplasma parvum]AGX89126.1 hypothetical protein PRV_01940 [Mycoplasma parvum str. Indiana]
MLKKWLILGLFGCPTGVCFGINLEKYLSLGQKKSIEGSYIETTEEIKEKDQKKISVGNESNVTITLLEENNKKHKNRIKVSINCMDGDLIGWEDNFLDKNPSATSGWDKFQQTFQKGLEGYLNLIFGCDYKRAVEAASSEDWWNTEKFGKNLEDIATVSLFARAGKNSNEELNNSDILRGGRINDEKTDFEKIWKLFKGPIPRDAKKRVITNTAAEIWLYDKNEHKHEYVPMIQKLVRESIANSLMRLVFDSTWYTKRYFDAEQRGWKYKEEQKYSVSEEFNTIVSQNDQDETFKRFKLDGNEGFKWHPGDGKNGGKPKWMWEKIKKWNSNEKEWWQEVKKYLKDISASSYFSSKNSEVAKVLCYEIFKNLIGQKKLQLIKSKDKWCKIGWNGVTCPNGGLAWRKE